MFISEETLQRFLLFLLSWYHAENDTYRTACHLTRAFYPQYNNIACIEPIPNEEVRREIETDVFYPTGHRLFPEYYWCPEARQPTLSA